MGKYKSGKSIFASILAIFLAVTFLLSVSLNRAFATTIAPSFPSCESKLGTTGDRASYDGPTDTHQIVGGSLLTGGTDNVYSLGDHNFLQCYCPAEGNEGIQTNWMWTTVEVLDWIFGLNGPDWGLDSGQYAAYNSNFNCDPEPTPTPITPSCEGDIPSTLLVDATRTITNNPDSGEGGNYWAKDNFSQRMRVWEVGQGDSRLYCGQTDDNGTFDTIAGEKSPGNTTILNGSEDGTFYGSTRVKISGTFSPVWGTFTNVGAFNFDIPAEKIGYSTDPNWIDKYFPGSSFTWISWGWHYKSCGHGAWNNTDTGNSGDIVPGPTDEVCQTPTPAPTPTPTTTTNSNDGGDGLGCAVNDCSGNRQGSPVVQGTGTGGQVLGASTMAGAGTFAENLNLVIMIIGGTLSFLGVKNLKKV
jgi:hypothetical protein